MRRHIYIWFILAWSFPAHAQVLTIKDRITHQPLELVSVYSNHPKAFAVTDVQGRANLSEFERADSIHIELIGYKFCVYSFQEIEKGQFMLFLEEMPIMMNQLVVSATRWQQQKREVPNKIIALRAPQLRLQNPQTAADLLAQSGEIFIQKSQLGGGSPMIRGFATNRVLITVDGVRMNTAIFRSGNLQNVISLDPFATEKTEIIFGPGSIIYGSDAIGGVMSFYTLEPKLSSGGGILVKGSAVARSSSADFEKTGHFDVNIGWGKWASVTSATYSDFDDLKMGSDGPEDYLRPEYAMRINGRDSVLANPDPKEQLFSGYSQFNLMQKIRFKANEHWDIHYGLHYSESSDIPRYDRLIEYRKGTLRDAQWYYGPQKWLMSSIKLYHLDVSKLYDKAQMTLAYQFFEESRHDRGFGKTALNHRIETVGVYSANLDFEKSFAPKHRMLYGGEIVFNSVGSKAHAEDIETGDTESISTRYPDGSVWNSFSGYLNYLLYASNAAIFQSGIRYNRVVMRSEFDTTFFPLPFTSARLNTGALTASLGGVLRPSTTLEVDLNISSGFRAPNVDDMGKIFDSEPGSVIVPNPDLKPEYAYNAEFGIIKTFGEITKIDLAAYYTLLDKALVRRNFTLNGQDSIIYDGTLSQVLAIQNAADAYVWGLQGGIEMLLPAGLSLVSRLNFQKGEEELDNGITASLRHAAPWNGTTHLIYKRERFKVDLYGMYNGTLAFADMAPSEQAKPNLYAVDGDGNPYAPGWYTINCKCMYQLTDYLMMSAGVENITDQRYRPYSSGISAPGRNFIVALSLTY